MRSSTVTYKKGRPPMRTTGVILHGTALVSALLALLLIFYGISNDALLRGRTGFALILVAYIVLAELFYKYRRYKTVCWMLVCFYAVLAFLTLLHWGLNAPVGILTASFLVILPGVLMGYRYILPVAISVVAMLSVVHFLNSAGFVHPNLAALSVPSTEWDVLTYSTILSVFALVSWISGRQTEQGLYRAQQAEAKLREQKDTLRIELEAESAALRQVELRQMRQLHTFALIGQSTSATLHELSNHLSILNLDIDDLRAQHKHSRAVTNAQTSIKHVNKLVAQTRQQLSSYGSPSIFNAVTTIRQATKDVRPKYKRYNAALIQSITSSKDFKLNGSPMALMQIITILLNNALDACYDTNDPSVSISVTTTSKLLTVRVEDSGSGVDQTAIATLFKPHISHKPNGLGVGLYIAHQLATSQFDGTLRYIHTPSGATFELQVPRYERK